MRAAVWRRHRVAVRAQEAIGVRDPGNCPFEGTMPFRLLDPPREHVLGDGLLALDAACEEILEPAREVEHCAFWRLGIARKQLLGARPADLDAAEEVGLRARHAEQKRRRKGSTLAEDLGIRSEADARAAAILDRPKILQRAVGNAPRVALAIDLLPRATSTSMFSDRALATETPTPCKPPLVS